MSTTQTMLINHVPGAECRIALVEDGKLEELYHERTSADLHVGNIYRGRVTNVEPSIQAAFIDFGLERNGFLHITDVHPRYFPGEDAETTEQVGRKTPRRDRPPIQQCFKRGQSVLVQVLKEGLGTKGPTLTSYLSIPGRYLVMMPHMERHGVSRKIDDPEKRREAHRILDELDPPEGFGFIVRTAGFNQTKTELKRDLSYLLRLWQDIDKRNDANKRPTQLWAESDLMTRTLRDVMTTNVDRIIVDDRAAALRAKQFLRLVSPRGNTRVFHHDGPTPIFDAFGIESQIQSINYREVPLPNGGSLVFDQTEAMVAIDVNSGKSRDQSDAESTAYKTNLEAVEEIARQLRLRDLGGLIVMDLIDMYQMRHRREVEKAFQNAIKRDRARTKVLKISDLGLMEMTRQRMRPSLKKAVFDACPTCQGAGQVLSVESTALEAMRRIAAAMSAQRVAAVTVTVHPDVISDLFNRRRIAVVSLEQATGKNMRVLSRSDISPDTILIDAVDSSGATVDPDKLPAPQKPQLNADHEIQNEHLDELESLPTEPDMAPAIDAPADPAKLNENGEQEPGKKKRRRRRRRKKKNGESAQFPPDHAPDDVATDMPETPDAPETDASETTPTDEDPSESATDAAGDIATPGKKKRRRRRRRRRKNSGEPITPGDDTAPTSQGYQSAETAPAHDASSSPVKEVAISETPAEDVAETEKTPKKKRSRRPRKKAVPKTESTDETDEAVAVEPAPKKKTTRRRKKKTTSTPDISPDDGEAA